MAPDHDSRAEVGPHDPESQHRFEGQPLAELFPPDDEAEWEAWWAEYESRHQAESIDRPVNFSIPTPKDLP